MHCKWKSLFAWIVLLVTHARADIVFDTASADVGAIIDAFSAGGLGGHLPAGGRYAQQFLTGPNDTVDSITLPVGTWGGDNGGPFNVEIWNDNGAGIPGDFVTFVGEFSQRHTDLGFQSNEPISGLKSNRPYYVVIESTVDTSPLFFFGIGDAMDSALAHGAAPLLVNTDGEWNLASQALPAGDPNFPFSINDYLVMQVNASTQGTGLPCDFDKDGALGASDIDLLSLAIRTNNNEETFDLTHDHVVDMADLGEFVTSPEKLNTYFGDANLDGEFNSADLVQVFQAGQYEDDIDDNGTWSTGDWNADSDFASGDLVAAFQDGGYEQGPRVAANAVPEPTSLFILLAGLIGIAVRRRDVEEEKGRKGV